MTAAPVSPPLSVELRKRYAARGRENFFLQVKEEFAPGFTVLFGPSGAGKSTLLDCIAGLATPDSGRIHLGEQIFFDSSRRILVPPQRRGMAYVFQSLALFPHLSAEENICYGLSNMAAAEREERVGKILRSFHVEALRHRKPGELSGGEKQRVALARSLVTQPGVLLLDEPLTGLDAGLRSDILDDLRAWNGENGIPILYVTHNRDEVNAVGERVVVIVDGAVRETGLPAQVLDAPRSMALAQIAGFENLLPVTVLQHRPADGVMRVALLPSMCELEIPLGKTPPGTAMKVAIRAGDILLAIESPRGLSARNILPGKIESLTERGSLIEAGVDAGARFVVHLTPGAKRALQLAVGMPVWLVLKTHSCHVVAE